MSQKSNRILSARSISFLTIFSLMFFISCVTVNVNFPEGAVQRAADDYVSELYKAKAESEDGKKEKARQKNSSSLWEDTGRFVASLVFGERAHAVEVEFKVFTDEAKAIQQRQAGRLATIDKYKAKGVIGEGNGGLLDLRDSSALKPIEKKKVVATIAEENSDRNLLYQEIVKSNQLSGNMIQSVRSSFASSFVKASPAGTWFEDKAGKWSKK